MYCQNCGKEVTGNFCPNCGAKVIKDEPKTSEQEKTQAEPQKAELSTVNKPDKFSKPIHIISLVFSVFIFAFSVAILFLNSLISFDLSDMVLLIAAGNAPFSLALFLASAFRGKSKVASAILYVLSIISSLFLCCLNLACTDDFLLLPLLNILFVITAWIFGNRCAVRKIEKAQIIMYVCFILIVVCFLLYWFSGDIALSRSASNLFEGIGEHSFYDEVETARNLFE